MKPKLFLLIISFLILSIIISFQGSLTSFFTKQKLNLVIISIDTLRADRLGVYGYSRDTSPQLDRFAQKSAIFENAISVAPWTLPSHVSLFSGLYPTIHGVTQPKGVKISKNTPLLAEILQAHGYRNFGYAGGGYVSKQFGFNRGFEKYGKVAQPKQKGKSDFEAVFKKAKNVLETIDNNQPFFLFLHSYDVHCPYIPPEPFFSMYQSVGAKEIDPNHCGGEHYNKRTLEKSEALYLSDRYDGGIRWVDHYIGEFLDFLDKRGDLEKTVVVITSDHGEEFLEHGRIGHEMSLHNELLKIPLIIYVPGIKPIRVNSSVSNVDIVTTVSELLNIPINHLQNGSSLVPLMYGKNAQSKVREFQFSELDRQINLRSIISLKNHFIKDSNSSTRFMYDLESDSSEQNNLFEKDLNLTRRHEAYIDEIVQSLKKGEGEELGELAPESLESLKSLGYL